jgi:hypothetical protein
MLISECGLEESEAFTLERSTRGAERVLFCGNLGLGLGL